MIHCPYYETDTFPPTYECRENRHDNRMSGGTFCKPCAGCGRDLGPKKDMGGKRPGTSVDRYLPGKEPTLPPSKVNRREVAHRRGPSMGQIPADTNLMCAAGTPADSKNEGRATGKDAPRIHSCPNCNVSHDRTTKLCAICHRAKKDQGRLSEIAAARAAGELKPGRKGGRKPGFTRHGETRRGWPKGQARASL